eukprot:COSAG02_NODE_7547_length_2966_cov_63.943844_1_plen_517_part_10
MLLRVRGPGETYLKIRCEPSTSYADLIAEVEKRCEWSGEPGALQLSLNKKEPLELEQADNIGSAGIRGGDLLYMLADDLCDAITCAPPVAARAARPAAASSRQTPAAAAAVTPGSRANESCRRPSMLLRIREPSGTWHKVRCESSIRYADLIAEVEKQCAWDGEAATLRLSLNKKDPLELAQKGTLASVGIRCDELLYIIEDTVTMAPAPAPPAPPPSIDSASPSKVSSPVPLDGGNGLALYYAGGCCFATTSNTSPVPTSCVDTDDVMAKHPDETFSDHFARQPTGLSYSDFQAKKKAKAQAEERKMQDPRYKAECLIMERIAYAQAEREWDCEMMAGQYDEWLPETHWFDKTQAVTDKKSFIAQHGQEVYDAVALLDPRASEKQPKANIPTGTASTLTFTVNGKPIVAVKHGSNAPLLIDAAAATGEADQNAAPDGVEEEDKTTLVIFEKEGPLGMTFGSAVPTGDPPVTVSRIDKKGLAAQQPALRRGLVILSIQGDDVSEKPLKDIIRGIKRA